ncbi:MAG: PAS domain S-box protein [Planctomycetes bacterium]|nr:PAS domain S-box protein [Planctomycetota bacterium]
MTAQLAALLVEDSPDDALLMARELRRAGWEPAILRVETAGQMRDALASRRWDVVLCDYSLPHFGVLEALELLRSTGLDVPFLIVSGAIGEDKAVEAMRAGAHDYVMKGNLARLGPAIERELREAGSRTNRLRAERELRDRESHLSAVLGHVAEGILVFDEEGRIESANPATERIFGWTRAELTGRRIVEIVGLPDAGLSWIPPVGREELGGRSRSGASLDIALAVSEMKRTDARRLFIAVARDVTEEKRMARRLLEQASLARVGAMAAVVAHEVKNPLAGIKGAVEVIGSHLPLDSRDRPIVCEIVERIDALDRIVRDLLLFARPRLPRPEPTPLLALLRESVSLLSPDPVFQRVAVEISGEEITIPLDPELMKSVFSNLLLNAAQAMEGHGRIRVAVSPRPGSCRVVIQDTGPGIPPEHRERLFEPFFTTKHRGSGLGLATAKRIVEGHGGRIRIACPPSGGTQVEIDLPALG